MAESLKLQWKMYSGASDEYFPIHVIEHGDCTGVLLSRGFWDTEVRLWLADELVLHTYATGEAMGKRQIEAWLEANHLL